MSTIQETFTTDELDEFVSDLKEWPNSMYGNDEAVHSVSPFVSFYFLYDTHNYLDTSLLMVDIHQAFERITGQPYKIATHPDSERPHPYGSRRLPDLREFSKKTKVGEHFLFKFTDEEKYRSSPATAGYFWKKPDYMNDGETENQPKSYSYMQLYYRWQWWLDNRDAWRQFVLDTINKLNPQQVYSGFAMANPLEYGTRSEVSVWERSLTTMFYGLDIDDSSGMSMGLEDSLPDGIRPPTWAFFLSDDWRCKLSMSRDEVRAALAHSHITITDCDTGLWIELGEKPELYPVEGGVPELPVLLNKILRPIRNDNLDLVGTGQWDGDPNERFTKADAKRWLGRFDADSDWPSKEIRAKSTPANATTPKSTPAGKPAPQSGWWLTPAKENSRRYFKQGDVFPNIEGSAYGATFWQWSPDQSTPRLK